jgi:hypothetical protein
VLHLLEGFSGLARAALTAVWRCCLSVRR